MMSQQLGFSVLSAPIAAIDRRALSQAWYSALHLAHGLAKEPALTGNRTHAQKNGAPSRIHGRRSDAARCARAEALSTPRESRASRSHIVEADRRAPRSPLARKIERVFLHPARAPERTTFSLEGDRGRVHVSVQSGPSGFRLIAVCSPRARALVAHALQEARFALAARGIVLGCAIAE
jgi:hypothetical protein